jgi:hypothetical protein
MNGSLSAHSILQEPWGGDQFTDFEQEDYSDQSNFTIEPRPPDILPDSISSLDWQNSYGQLLQEVQAAGDFLTGPTSRTTDYAGGCDPQPSIRPSTLLGRERAYLPETLGSPLDTQRPQFRGRRHRSETPEVGLDSASPHVTKARTAPYPSRSRSRTRPEVQSGFRARVSSEASKKASEARRTADAPHKCPHCSDTFTRQDGLRGEFWELPNSSLLY